MVQYLHCVNILLSYVYKNKLSISEKSDWWMIMMTVSKEDDMSLQVIKL